MAFVHEQYDIQRLISRVLCSFSAGSCFLLSQLERPPGEAASD